MCNFVREVSLRTRNFHTTTHKSPFKTIARLFASQHNSKCGKKDECEPKPKKCKKNLECPNFVMENCPPAHFRIGCKREYEEPECKKVNAPYKSYSELCAQRLPDDPSECMQCPWQRCGGVDDIKPPKRKYHTTTLAQTLNSSQAAPEFFYDCDAKKCVLVYHFQRNLVAPHHQNAKRTLARRSRAPKRKGAARILAALETPRITGRSVPIGRPPSACGVTRKTSWLTRSGWTCR
ncbi:unnamed protein product [Acanthoscelides obtectus]|uniref:Uncharacterized protein n=1 Tax=Acanthoscelides obtectus TaxID=200917 RepID=A0A9P0L8I9_ACAOB|nr:unnamed protein product [Acanthoscelides obtectus]CAK1649251.1 hypothetical protein AOBTE_LOCUS16110 [Acanthoscelides obtectus]